MHRGRRYTVRSNTGTDGGSPVPPADEPNDSVLALAPPILDVDKELLEFVVQVLAS